MEDQLSLGQGSRVRHPAFGDGVVIALHPAAYDVSFMLYGIKSVGRDYDKWEIIEAVPAQEAVTFSDMEKSLIRILPTAIHYAHLWQSNLLQRPF